MITGNSVRAYLCLRGVILSRAAEMAKKEAKIVSQVGTSENVLICSRVKRPEG